MNNCSILNNIAVVDPSLGLFQLFYVKILEIKQGKNIKNWL